MRSLVLGDMMTANVKTRRVDDTLSSADGGMVTSEVRHLPVVDAAGRVVGIQHSALPVVDDAGMLLGIVTTTDFVELAHRALAGLDIHQPHAGA